MQVVVLEYFARVETTCSSSLCSKLQKSANKWDRKPSKSFTKLRSTLNKVGFCAILMYTYTTIHIKYIISIITNIFLFVFISMDIIVY